MKARGGFGSLAVLILNLGIGWGGCTAPRCGRFTPRELAPCACLREDG